MKTNQIKNGELLPMYTLLYRELKDDSLHISVYSGEKCWLWNKRDMLFSSGVLWFCLKNKIPKLLEFFPIHSIGQNLLDTDCHGFIYYRLASSRLATTGSGPLEIYECWSGCLCAPCCIKPQTEAASLQNILSEAQAVHGTYILTIISKTIHKWFILFKKIISLAH